MQKCTNSHDSQVLICRIYAAAAWDRPWSVGARNGTHRQRLWWADSHAEFCLVFHHLLCCCSRGVASRDWRVTFKIGLINPYGDIFWLKLIFTRNRLIYYTNEKKPFEISTIIKYISKKKKTNPTEWKGFTSRCYAEREIESVWLSER